MWHKRITSDDILRGNVKLPRKTVVFNPYTASNSRWKNWAARLFLSVTVACLLFLSTSLFFPDVAKGHYLLTLFCVGIACFCSVYVMYAVGIFETAITTNSIVTFVIEVIISML